MPAGFSVLSAHLVVDNAVEAIEFYKKAFGATEIFRMPTPDGNLIMHCEMQVGDSRLMLCDDMPEQSSWRSPRSLGSTSVTVHLWTEDCDAAFQRAIEAGATERMPLFDAFWGDRLGKVTDPYGHEWAISTHIKDMTPAEIAVAALEMFSGEDWARKKIAVEPDALMPSTNPPTIPFKVPTGPAGVAPACVLQPDS